ncbi:hypothetical protein R3P38DRAFT_962917 [Favolaschia claudopus]|uniref:Ubinuclein middle domain-containing protein n=1 Tax=Favolaschia claudopus TaxID=2862362 RepID=A0AAW0E7U3_9AGAR
MDSDVEMVENVADNVERPPPSPHVSPDPDKSDLDDDVADDNNDLQADEGHETNDDDEHSAVDPNPDTELPLDSASAPPTTNDDDEALVDGYSSESENSSDNASEDDVDKHLVVDAPDTDQELSALSTVHWDDGPASNAEEVVVVGDDDSNGIRIPVLVNSSSPNTPPAPTSPLSAPPTSAAKDVAAAPAPSQPKPKPKSHHAPPPPPPPPPPPQMQTIRLDIPLGGPDNYEVDVKGMAMEAGLVWGELAEKKYADDSSDGEDDEDGEDGGPPKDKKDADGDVVMEADGKPKPAPKKKSKKKSKAAGEYYDTADPFIDDSELAIDERTYFAQTKQKGFYVSSGEVALVRDKSPKKPKSKKKMGPALSLNLPTASTSALKPLSTAGGPKKAKSVGAASGSKSAPASKVGGKALGTKDSPIALEDEDEDTKPDVFGSQAGGGRRASVSGKGKEKAEEGDDASVAEGVNRMKGKWKERVSVNGAPISANGTSVNGDDEADGDDEVGQKRKRAVNGVGGDAKKRKTVDVSSFHPDLQVGIEKMKQAIAAESWEQKSKFPPNLKPLVAALSLQAVSLNEYDDTFFSLMPTIFPYNKFTMSKLIKRTIFHDHTALLNQKQDELLEELKGLAVDGFAKAQEEWEKNMQNYEEKKKEKEAAAANGGGDPESVEGSTGPTRHGTEDPEAPSARVGSQGLSAGDKDEKEGGNGKEGPGKGGAHHGPPLKKFRMTEPMKNIVWGLVTLSNEICRLENEKNQLEGSVLQVSEQGLRKVLYQRIVAAFPEGWMSSGQISRDVSAMKKKLEKEAADD